MALDKQTVSLNLGDTLDQKDNDKVGTPGTFNDLKDWVWNKIKRLDKRPGTRKIATTVQSSFPNPLTIGTSVIPSGVAAHRDQLLLQNKGVLYTYLENESKWKFVGHQYPLQVKQTTAASLQQNAIRPNSGKIGNVSVTAFVEIVASDSFGTTMTSNLRISVFDELTQSFIVSNQIIETNNNQSYFAFPQVITFASTCYVVWQAYNSGGSQNEIHSVSVNLSTGATGTIQVLKTAVTIYNGNQDPTQTGYPGLDWVYTNKVGVGERAFITYCSAINTATVFALKSDGTVDTTMGTWSVTVSRGAGIYYHAGSQSLVLGYQAASLFRTFAAVATFTTSAITLQANIQIAANDNFIHAISFCDDPTNSAQFYAVWDVYAPEYVNGQAIYPSQLCYAVLSTSAVVSSQVPWARGVSMVAKPYADTLRNTVYVPGAQKSLLQDTLLLLDLKRGKSEAAAFVQAKWCYGDNMTDFSPYLPAIVSLGTNKISFLSMRKARINQAQSLITSQSATSGFYVCEIVRNEIDLAPKYTASHVFANNGTYFSGGYLGVYDGVQFSEQGFFVDPESIEVFQPAANDRVAISTVQSGTVSVPAIYNVRFYGGSAMLAGPTFYWTFNTPGGAYLVWYKINGVGTAPVVGGRTSLEVDITGMETAWQLAKLTAAAIQAAVPDITATAEPTVMRLQMTVNGSVTAPTSTNFQIAPSVLVPTAGKYQYSAIWSWIDHNGQLVRSAPVAGLQITTTVTQPIVVNLYVPPITNRTVSECKIELYRTQAGPSASFNRIMTLTSIPSWDTSRVAISFLDGFNDTIISTNEFLYTNGGVLENYQVPACTNLSLYKNRVLASGMNESEVLYSKAGIIGAPMEFSQVLSIVTEQDGEAVKGHRQMDDKLVIFKEKKIIAFGGDGANELGQGSTLSQPLIVASDVGLENQNSIEIGPDGLLFKSKMGIQKLDRSLQVSYPGIAVKDYNGFSVARSQVLRDDEKVREIRFVLDGTPNTLVYDYLVGKWSVFTNYDGQDACLWKGSFTRVDSNGLVSVEDKSLFVDSGSSVPSYSPLLETQWLKIKNVQDFQRVCRLAILGDLKSAHLLNFKIYYDYDESNYDSYTFNSAQISGSAPGDSVYQPELHLKRQKCQAIKIVMTVTPVGGTEESLTLTDMSFTVGVKRGLNKVKAGKKL